MQNDFERPSLNLTPERGPSVWERDDCGHVLGPEGLALIVGGAVLVASSTRQRRSLGAGTAALGVAFIAAGWFCNRWMPEARSWVARLACRSGRLADETLDRASEDSFPASDAPSSMQIA